MEDKTRKWYLLWAPAGVGGTTRRIVEIQQAIGRFDPAAVVWYPLRPEVVNGRTYMKALYAGYIFVSCIWTPMIEDELEDKVPTYLIFLKDVETMAPVVVAEGDMSEVRKVVDEIIRSPETFLQATGLKIDDEVKISKKAFRGKVGVVRAFLPKGRVVVELQMFGRQIPVAFESKDLQLL